jgi:hypothetical protein
MFRHHLTHMAGVQFNEQTTYAGVDEVVEEWPAAGSVDTEIGCFRKPEASDAEAQVQSRVQDRGGPLGA